MGWPTFRDLTRFGIHDVIVFLVGLNIGRLIYKGMESRYGDMPWWAGILVYSLVGIACNMIYFGVGLEIESWRNKR